ncbi:4854_t:CDS:1, partial [Cetraspora pellucida]
MKSHHAMFHISLISARWYKNNKISEDQDLVASQQPIKLCESTESSAHNSDDIPHTIDFLHLLFL